MSRASQLCAKISSIIQSQYCPWLESYEDKNIVGYLPFSNNIIFPESYFSFPPLCIFEWESLLMQAVPLTTSIQWCYQRYCKIELCIALERDVNDLLFLPSKQTHWYTHLTYHNNAARLHHTVLVDLPVKLINGTSNWMLCDVTYKFIRINWQGLCRSNIQVDKCYRWIKAMSSKKNYYSWIGPSFKSAKKDS